MPTAKQKMNCIITKKVNQYVESRQCKLNCVKLSFVGSELADMSANSDREFIKPIKELQIKVFFRPVS